MYKQNFYTENKIYPYCQLSDLRKDLIIRARKLALNQDSNHIWKDMKEIEILKSLKLYTKDFMTNKKGFTLAAILLFGKDETILSVLPHHKTDLILRKINLDRYDDRDDVRTNLIESYDRIMAFISKHLPDTFFTEGSQRISLREKIFREVASNTLIHREYFNAIPAKIIIEKNRVYSENSNIPHSFGLIDPKNFSPHPKNPVIGKVFKEIGYADELGSGVRNLTKYVKIYSEDVPQLIENNIFQTIIPLKDVSTPQATPQATPQVPAQVTHQVPPQVDIPNNDIKKINLIKKFCIIPKTREDIQKHLNIKDKEYFRLSILKPLLSKGILKMSIPDKPNSPKQKYYSEKGDKPS